MTKPKWQNFPDLCRVWLQSQAQLAEGTRDRYEWAIKSLSKHFHSLYCNQLAEAAEQWQVKRRAEVSPQTFNLELITLNQIVRWGNESGKPTTNPIASIQPSRRTQPALVVPSRDEMQKMIAFLTDTGAGDEADTIAILAYSGMRRAELLALRWRHVDFTGGTVTIGAAGDAKNGKSRTIPMFAPLREVLQRVYNATEAEHKTPDDFVCAVNDIRYHVLRACAKLSLAEFHPWHCWRHYFATRALEQGVDVKTLASWLGHSDGGVLVLKTYTHVTDEHSRRMAERIGA